MILAAFAERWLASYMMVFSRTGGLMAAAPLFGSTNIPAQVRAALAALLALLLTPTLPVMRSPDGVLDAVILLGREFMTGALLGLVAYFLFVGAQLAGQIIDLQMGFGIVNVIDPVTSAQVSVMGQFQFLVAILAYLAVDGPQLVLAGLGESFRRIPLGTAALGPAGLDTLTQAFAGVFTMSFRFAAPAIAALLLTNLAMGVLARTVPQMNVFIVGLPVSIAVGLFIVAASVSFLALSLGAETTRLIPSDMAKMIKAIR